ncbi:MAG TPA: pyridoxamine 5'-phosphate oxidase family protein, partial [Gemmatimonadales bacterium]|nr:pyridoxamine 5'-phosphate oxidase family protein [Gemmatimonadales bacterium]
VLLGAADAAGRAWATLLRGAPGFASVPSADRLHLAAVPPPGDPLAATLAAPAEVGTLLIDPPTRRRMRLNGRARPDGAGGLEIEVRQVYANCPRYIQPRTVSLPGTLGAPVATGSRITPGQRAWLEQADTLFIATRHPGAGADVSHRGGAPGFVRVPEAGRVQLADYPGNMMFNTLGNVAVDGRAGLLLVDFDSGRTLQLSGRATIVWEAGLVATFPGAQRVLELDVEALVETAGPLPEQAPAG